MTPYHNSFELLQMGGGWLAVIVLTFLAYKYLHDRWKRRERPRIVIGVCAVMLPSLVLSVAGLLDLNTWGFIFCGFGVAGACTMFLDIQQETEQAQKIRGVFDAKSNE